MSTTVTLSWVELQQAAFIGCQRRIRAIYKGRLTTNGAGEPPNDLWGNDVAAAGAEMAVAKTLDRFWGDSPDPDYSGDVGDIHVRSTSLVNGCLLLHESDPDDARFVLVVGKPPTYHVAGWLHARDGKSERFWRADLPRPCFLVPQPSLHELTELR